MMKPILRIENLSKQYAIGAKAEPYSTFRESLVRAARRPFEMIRGGARGERSSFWALSDVSFEVMPGEVVGIIGRNGAGKSTLLKVLSRITEPTKGRIELYGRVGSLLEVGTGFHPELSGRENIYLNGAILGMRRHEIAKKFDEIVDFAEIEDFLDTPVKRYSSGMYVRLAFAVAAHLDPEILVVDEVLAVGDAKFQKKCIGKMGQVAKGGRTVLFVSHNHQAVTQLCKTAVYLDNGRVRNQGDVLTILGQYQDDLERSEADSRRTGNVKKGEIKYIDWYIENSPSGKGNSIHSGEEAQLVVMLACKRDLSESRPGIVISDESGKRLIAVNSVTSGIGERDLKSGTYVVRWTLNLPLKAGFYNVRFTLHRGAEAVDDWTSQIVILNHDKLSEEWEGVLDLPVKCEVLNHDAGCELSADSQYFGEPGNALGKS